MYDLEEQEQIDSLKAWWKQYHRWVIGLLLGTALVGGCYRGWVYYQDRQMAEAGQRFEVIREAARAADPGKALAAAQQLENEQPGSGMASRGALMAAAVCHEHGRVGDVLSQLTWVEQHSKEPPLIELARLRAAGQLSEQKRYDEALHQLDANHDPQFLGLTLDLRGDILLALGRMAEARAAYQGAVDKSSPMDALHQLAQIKWEALGGKR
ncbi:MAG: tetratricopeptide repeat protein [Betaproteobacteria bacterium]|jgi:Uncharacterized protein conserved in bacteria|nr:tetratricopeptide repeat protein [Betaproteobacteria bacterium]